jgi:3-dehydroquinate dehydratase/shikimate dehydrogenase
MEPNSQGVTKLPQKVLSIRSLKSLKTVEFLEYKEKIDFFELRLDLFDKDDLLSLYDLIQSDQKYILKSDCLDKIFKFLSRCDAYVDIDFLSQRHWIEKLSKSTVIILSCHASFDEVAFDAMVLSMKKIPANFYKLAITPKNNLEALKIILAIQRVRDKRWMIFLVGRDYGYSRVLSAFFHQPFLYLCIKGFETAPGQFSIQEWMDYFDVINNPVFLGLVGDPVDKSCSMKIYNRYFRKKNTKAIYLKIRLKPEEFIEGVQLLKKIGFLGLSITTPHKERATYFAKHLSSVNTLLLKDEIQGCQTDGVGLINLVKTKLVIQGSRVLILGAGGAAKACALALYENDANIIVHNRTKEKVAELAKVVPVKSFDETETTPFDLVIQATSKEFFGDTSPYPLIPTSSQTIFIELVSCPIFTKFLRNRVDESGCIFFGFEHFLAQGLVQLKVFFPNDKHETFSDDVREIALKWFLSLN